ncbi:uncharacterized protein K452DRAFT_58514 [Aplosporella prunicola CBS 121167]|uniref:Uncharacterized protein n=1 Tax=Aplosporella prunicola CBS 121167 TaxID=1176127 RepID=A0A6A6BAL4_9PEZI|nr:uncharacterized protein K452DRAFT_58514 [Aplosporella prunicola CBS 121167]KAF2139947.1 hypothetical protein K452DRAFT_58514 [Aplosporella prunicola CBS 121167]
MCGIMDSYGLMDYLNFLVWCVYGREKVWVVGRRTERQKKKKIKSSCGWMDGWEEGIALHAGSGVEGLLAVMCLSFCSFLYIYINFYCFLPFGPASSPRTRLALLLGSLCDIVFPRRHRSLLGQVTKHPMLASPVRYRSVSNDLLYLIIRRSAPASSRCMSCPVRAPVCRFYPC